MERPTDSYEFQPRGEIAIKGKGPMETYFLISSSQTPAAGHGGVAGVTRDLSAPDS